jgi:hypothetical protein
MLSPKDLTKDKKIKRVFSLDSELFPGWIICVCDNGKVMLVNVFTMTLLQEQEFGWETIHHCNFQYTEATIQLMVTDKTGHIFVVNNLLTNHLI